MYTNALIAILLTTFFFSIYQRRCEAFGSCAVCIYMHAKVCVYSVFFTDFLAELSLFTYIVCCARLFSVLAFNFPFPFLHVLLIICVSSFYFLYAYFHPNVYNISKGHTLPTEYEKLYTCIKNRLYIQYNTHQKAIFSKRTASEREREAHFHHLRSLTSPTPRLTHSIILTLYFFFLLPKSTCSRVALEYI